MGVDWYPFLLKPGVSRIEFETLIFEQRQEYIRFEQGDFAGGPCRLDPFLEYGRVDDFPESTGAIRLRPIADHPIFPRSWKMSFTKPVFPKKLSGWCKNGCL